MGPGDQVSLFVAFGAGLASFLAPCTLPMVPVYATYLLGAAGDSGAGDARRVLLTNALAFVAGFSVVFVSLGVSATLLGQLLLANQGLLRKGAGLLVFVFGLHLTGLLHIGWLERQVSLTVGPPGGALRGWRGFWRSLLLGVAFSAGWHPCVGPILGAILAYAGTASTVGSGVRLLLAYSAGMALPFVVLAVFFERIRPLVSVLNRHSLQVSRVAGVLMMFMGAAIYLDAFAGLARFVPAALAL